MRGKVGSIGAGIIDVGRTVVIGPFFDRLLVASTAQEMSKERRRSAILQCLVPFDGRLDGAGRGQGTRQEEQDNGDDRQLEAHVASHFVLITGTGLNSSEG